MTVFWKREIMTVELCKLYLLSNLHFLPGPVRSTCVKLTLAISNFIIVQVLYLMAQVWYTCNYLYLLYLYKYNKYK